MSRDFDYSSMQEPLDRAGSRSSDKDQRLSHPFFQPVENVARDRQAPEQSRNNSGRRREPLGRDNPCRISPAERLALTEIGRFRAVAVDDLAQFAYHGNRAQMMQDLRSLRAQGLLQRRTVWTGGNRSRMTVLALTRRGKQIVSSGDNASGQQFYAGLVKPGEVQHDAAIYRMYQREVKRIEGFGGKIRRIVLDYELKRKVFAPLAKARALPTPEYHRRQAEIARQSNLKVVRGKIPLPDLRIEYDTAAGQRTHVDLELATHHYRGSQVRAKAEAGFKMYAPQGSLSRLSAALDDPGIVADILSL